MFSTTTTTTTPTGPGGVRIDTDGTLYYGKSVLLAADRSVILSALEERGAIVTVDPSLAGSSYVKNLVLLSGAYLKKDFTGMIASLGRLVNDVSDRGGYPLSGPIAKKGVPKKDGAPEAGLAAAATLAAFPAETHNAHQDGKTLADQADYVQGGFDLEAVGLALVDRATRAYTPVLISLADGIRAVVGVVDPILPTHPDLSRMLGKAVDYLKDPRKKAVKNRKHNKKTKDQTIKETEAAALPKARDQVRAEVKGEIQDRISTLLK